MNVVMGWLKVSLGLALGLGFLLAQRSAPSRAGDEHVEDAREGALAVVLAIGRLIDDCGLEKVGRAIPAHVDVLVGPGELPRACPKDVAECRKLLNSNAFGIEDWAGPYLDAVGVDPWGKAFVVTAVGFADSRQRIWVVSAGRNGRLETTARDGAPHGDDIALLARW